MADVLRFTLLGCGSSPGVPRPNGDWGACDPANPKNRRTRAAALFERIGPGGVTRVAVDTGPDFRNQMIDAHVTSLEAVVYTHAHADHIHGMDDLRTYYLSQRRRVPIYADAATLARLREGFDYCFRTPEGSSYPPIVDPFEIDAFAPFDIEGAGGPLAFEPLPQQHGDIVSLGFRVGSVAYCSDVSAFPAATLERLRDLDLLVLDALQYNRHPSHFSLEQALDCIAALKPRRAVLTHMHTPLDYETVLRETPDHIEPGYDGMAIELPL